MTKDILPRTESGRVAALRTIIDVTTGHCIGSPPPMSPAWTWISTAELATLKELVQDLEEIFQKHLEEKSPASRAAKDAQFAIVLPKAREFIKKNLTQEQVGIEGRTQLGLPIADTIKTPVEIPELPPDAYAVINGEIPGLVRIRYRGGRPAGIPNCEIRYGFADAMPTNPETLLGAETFSKSPWSKVFLDDRGKTLYYALRWVVPGNRYGNWSDIKEVIIP